MTTSIFGEALSSLVPDSVERHIDGGLEASGAPSNQQIIDAARAGYAAHTPYVDTTARCNNSLAEQGTPQIASLNNYNWKSNLPDTSDATSIKDSGIFGPALAAANADTMLTTMMIGIAADAQIIVGGAGGIGVVWDLLSRESACGAAFVMVKVGLQVDVAVNILAGGFNQLPSALENQTFYGLQVYLGAGLGMQLNCFTTQLSDPQFFGFTVGIGGGIGVGASVFAGHFYTFG